MSTELTPRRKDFRLTGLFSGLCLLSGVIAVGTSALLRTYEFNAVVRPWFALLPLVPAVGAIFAARAWVQRLDEIQARLQLHGLVFAFPGIIMVAMSVELLQKAGYWTQFRWGWESLAAVMFGPYLIGLTLAWNRYR